MSLKPAVMIWILKTDMELSVILSNIGQKNNATEDRSVNLIYTLNRREHIAPCGFIIIFARLLAVLPIEIIANQILRGCVNVHT